MHPERQLQLHFGNNRRDKIAFRVVGAVIDIVPVGFVERQGRVNDHRADLEIGQDVFRAVLGTRDSGEEQCRCGEQEQGRQKSAHADLGLHHGL